MNRIKLGIALTAIVATTACGTESSGPLDGVDSIVFLQRTPREGSRDVFQYASYIPGGRIVKLSPPTADGTLTVLCCDKAGPEYADIDINSYDLSFDAKEIVFAGRLSGDQKYGLFVLDVESGQVEQLPTDPTAHYVYPVFLPGDKILFATTAVVEEGAPQFRDEYERGVVTQVGVINRDGSNETLGARNLSHRVFPTLMSDGRVLLTQWDHLGSVNAGRLITMNTDMSTVREAFGKERSGVTNSYYKAVEISPGRFVSIGSSRNGTVQAGTILDIRLGETRMVDGELWADEKLSEANSSYQILTPQVPRGKGPSSETIGRYYSAHPLNAAEYPQLIVSWADGPVDSGTLSAAGLTADFGVYLFDSKDGQRRPIWNDTAYWDVFPRPLIPRNAPPVIAPSGKNQFDENAVFIGSMNVYESSLSNFDPGSVYGVRIIEGFSSEEGAPRKFGLTLHEGAALLGTAEVRQDGSWAALIPATIPVHLQAIDKFGMALANEPVWISGNPGESRFCGGCHEDRAAATVIQPGITVAVAVGPDDLRSKLTRAQRKSSDFAMDKVIGVPWTTALQSIFDAKCISCHEGTPGPANPGFTISDPAVPGSEQTITFDLRGMEVAYDIGDPPMTAYSLSHLSLIGPDTLELQNAGLIVVGEMPLYISPQDARGSLLIQKLNPPQLFPTVDMNVRAFDGPNHPEELGQPGLTAEEYYLMVLMADMGGQYYSRENLPDAN